MDIPDRFRVYEAGSWLINHRVDSVLPGYLMLGSTLPVSDLSDLPDGALATLGPLLARAQRALKARLQPSRIYIGRYGHSPCYPVHFHLIPVYDWVEDLFRRDDRYRVLQQFADPAVASAPDGAELTLFIWREFCESLTPPPIKGSSIDETIVMLREAMRG